MKPLLPIILKKLSQSLCPNVMKKTRQAEKVEPKKKRIAKSNKQILLCRVRVLIYTYTMAILQITLAQ